MLKFALCDIVLLQPMKEDPPLDFKCKDKFLVQYAKILESEVDVAFVDLVSNMAWYAPCVGQGERWLKRSGMI